MFLIILAIIPLSCICQGFPVEDCFRNPYDACLKHLTGSTQQPEFPDSPDALDEFHSFLRKNLNCLEDFDNLCPDKRMTNNTLPIKVFQVPAALTSYRSLVHDLNTEGTTIHDVFYKNVKCIHDVSVNEGPECVKRSNQTLQIYKNMLSTNGIAADSPQGQVDLNCMSQYGVWDCYTAELGKTCGQDVEEANLDMFYRGYEAYDCKDDVDRYAQEARQLPISEAAIEHLVHTIQKFRYQ